MVGGWPTVAGKIRAIIFLEFLEVCAKISFLLSVSPILSKDSVI